MKVSPLISKGFALASLTALLPIAAHADSLLGNYYVMSSSNSDVENGVDGHVVTGLVNQYLDANGLPVVTNYGATRTGGSGAITDVNNLGELQWWTNGGTVSFEKQQTDTMPLNFQSNFFAHGASTNGGANGFRSVRWEGSFDLTNTGSITMNLGSDDDAWVFIDGKLQVDNGGVHALVTAPTTTEALSAGSHTIDLFFADRHTTQSGIYFDASVKTDPVPEPATLLALAPVAGFLIKRRKA